MGKMIVYQIIFAGNLGQNTMVKPFMKAKSFLIVNVMILKITFEQNNDIYA